MPLFLLMIQIILILINNYEQKKQIKQQWIEPTEKLISDKMTYLTNITVQVVQDNQLHRLRSVRAARSGSLVGIEFTGTSFACACLTGFAGGHRSQTHGPRCRRHAHVQVVVKISAIEFPTDFPRKP